MTTELLIYSTSSHTFDVRKIGKGHFEVYRLGATAATRVGTFHYSDNEAKALVMAMADADRRESLLFKP